MVQDKTKLYVNCQEIFIDNRYYLHYESCMVCIQKVRFLYSHTKFIATGNVGSVPLLSNSSITVVSTTVEL